MTVQHEENWRLRRRLAHTLILSKACWSHKDSHAHVRAHTHTQTHTHTHTHLLDITVSELKMRMCRVFEMLSHHHHHPFIERWENAKKGLYVWCCSSFFFFYERWLRGKDIKQTLLALGKINWIKAKVWKLISKFWPKEPRRGQK